MGDYCRPSMLADLIASLYLASVKHLLRI